MLDINKAYSRIPIYRSRDITKIWDTRYVYVLPDDDCKNRFVYFDRIPGNGWRITIDHRPRVTPQRVEWKLYAPKTY